METIPKCATLGNASRIHVKLKKKTFFFKIKIQALHSRYSDSKYPKKLSLGG